MFTRSLSENLIEKRQTKADRRKLELHVTDLGKKQLAQIEAVRSAQENRLTDGLTPRERKQLVALLIKTQDALRS